MLTLNQIKYILTGWFNNHAQINSTYYCDDFDFNAARTISYPVSNIEYMESNVKDKQTTHTYKIVLADLVDQNIAGHEDEIQSDMLQIAEDLFAWAQYYEGFSFAKSVNIQKFMDDTDDRTSGIVFKIQLTVIRSQNTCQIPTKIDLLLGD